MIVLFDNRGAGMSQREIQDNAVSPHLHAIDMYAVCKSLDLRHVNVMGMTGNCTKTAVFAAQHPELVDQLIFWAPINGPDFHKAQMGTVVSLASKDWKIFTETWSRVMMGWSGGRQAAEYASFVRESVAQELCVRLLEVIGNWDVTPYLSEIQAQTLVLSGRAGSRKTAQLVASGVRNAQLVRLPDSPVVYWEDEHALEAVEEFLGDAPVAARRKSKPAVPSGGADTHTILFTDMASSTTLADKLGDAAAQDVRRTHNEIVRAALSANGGAEIKHTGDGIMASFSTASSSLHCAIAIQRGVSSHKEEHPDSPLGVYIGLNAGEPIAEDDPDGRVDLFGTSVDLARRICDHAQPGQILASNVVRELAAGKQFLFSDIGEVVPKGFEEPVRLYEVSWRG